MLELRISNGAQAVPLFDLPAMLGRRGAAKEIGDHIEALIAFMDELGGDPDLEDDGTSEPDGTDTGDQAWPESIAQDRWPMSMQGGQFYEDAEDSDPREEDDHSGDGMLIEDGFEGYTHYHEQGPGCPISDPGE